MPSRELSYTSLIKLAVPIIIANCVTPLLGLTDTAVIGHLSDTTNLGAIALGALLFSFLYWGFGFLRMSTTGIIAQAKGRGEHQAILDHLLRALVLGFLLGVLIIALQVPLLNIALHLFQASSTIEQITADYFNIRIWSAPACLATYGIMGLLIGLGENKRLLVLQLFLNGVNIVLDLLFAGCWDLGAKGIAWGTLIAEWLTFFLGLMIVYQTLSPFRQHLQSPNITSLTHWHSIKPMLVSNANIMVRTLLLLLSFAIFTNQAARFGDVTLAANHLLLQIISFSAFFLDGFAFVTESLTGQAKGKRNLRQFDTVIKRSTLLAFLTAIALSALIYSLGNHLITMLTDITNVGQTALTYLPFAAIYILLSSFAFQLDGIFIGTSETLALRNAAIVSSGCFFLLTYALSSWLYVGLWLAFISYVVLRAITLLFYYPRIRSRLSAAY